MEVIRDLDTASRPHAGAAVTVGAYDGVHLGHRALLRELIDRAAERDLTPTVVTFDRHPASVVRPDRAPKLLCDLDQKLELLGDAGVERTLVVEFDEARSNESAEDFVERVLVGVAGARLIVVGEDFHFGHGRKGNVELLANLGALHGYEVDGFALATDPGGRGRGIVPISSTRIRGLLADGEVAAAAHLLGRDHEVRGIVVRGDGRGGTELGFPTANVEVPAEIALPAEGVYCGWFTSEDGVARPTAISVGRRPTFYENGRLLVEAYVLDFEGDLYGQRARVAFSERLRDDLAFDSVDELVEQMRADVARSRRLLRLE